MIDFTSYAADFLDLVRSKGPFFLRTKRREIIAEKNKAQHSKGLALALAWDMIWISRDRGLGGRNIFFKTGGCFCSFAGLMITGV